MRSSSGIFSLWMLLACLIMRVAQARRPARHSYGFRLDKVEIWEGRKDQTATWAIPRGGSQPKPPKKSIGKNFRYRLSSIFTRKREVVKPEALSQVIAHKEYNPLRMYLSCMSIVSVWIAVGTLFYSLHNQWPLPQSFFYAVDAGMSIGFCTEVHETKITSKAFTVIYILLGASVVGGALALFIQDAVEGVSMPSTREYQLLLEKEAFKRADVSNTGTLSFNEFQELLKNSSNFKDQLTEEDIQQLFAKFDGIKDGVIRFEEFVGTYRGIGRLVKVLQRRNCPTVISRTWLKIRLWLGQAWHLENRIYFVFCSWIFFGIVWGIVDQQWDPITAAHFAVSALATGGLTAPQCGEDGILPAEPAIFCGIYCLFGIPLFALTLGHFARFLVAGHVSAMERRALNHPLSREEYELAAHLTTGDSLVHLSDFIVLQLLRQGKITAETIQVLKQNFELLDVRQTGSLTIKEATSEASRIVD